MSLGIDVGGTFTDAVRWDGAAVRIAKTSSTTDQSDGVAEVARALVPAPVPLLVHGTTVATNALLERKGAVTVLVTDPGFEDLVEIGRQSRPSLYDPFADRAEPLASRTARFGWTGSSEELGRLLHRTGATAVAIGLLGSYRDGSSERRIAADLPAGLHRSLSHLVAPEFREYERINTTLVNAYLAPVVERYLTTLEQRLVPAVTERVLVMRSSGGLITPGEAAANSAAVLLSGPAGGVVASAELGRALGFERVISFDMGGTSTDVCRIENGRPEVAYERVIDGQTVRMPSVAVHTVGAGGGSLGWVDAGGALRVGPRSAGAAPGPACYGRGGMEPAITDAHLALGRLGTTLAGSLRLDRGAAVAALGRLGTAAGLDGGETAAGMIEVVEATMERAIRAVSVEEGADPRRAVLVAFGGAGGLHATALARRLEMRAVVVPPHAGVFSALGLVLAPPRQDVRRSVLLGEEEASRLDQALAEVAATAGRLLSGSIGAAPVRVETVVDVRYRGQAYETPVVHEPGAGWDVLAARFHTAHRRRNGFDRTGDPIEAVTVRAVAVGTPALSWNDLPDHVPTGDPAAGSRPVRVGGEELEMEVWWRPGLAPGAEVRGPAAVEDLDSTTWIAPGEQAVVHPTGALVVSW